MKLQRFEDGVAIHADSTEWHGDAWNAVRKEFEEVHLIATDPPYGNVLKGANWDKIKVGDDTFAEWMMDWTKMWSELLVSGGAMYVWGGIGKPGFRPFFKYLSRVEQECVPLEIANMITWSKKRAYGTDHNYLFTREECVYLCKGNYKKPRLFNIPLLDEKRGWDGQNKGYKCRSEYKRRTNVWTDISEHFGGKVHPAQKRRRLYEIPIEIHTQPGDVVLDMFAGSGVAALAARKLGRRWAVIEHDEETWQAIVQRLKDGVTLG